MIGRAAGAIAVLDGEAAQNGGPAFAAFESHQRRQLIAALDDGHLRTCQARNQDRLAQKTECLNVSSGMHQNGVAVDRGRNALLDLSKWMLRAAVREWVVRIGGVDMPGVD